MEGFQRYICEYCEHYISRAGREKGKCTAPLSCRFDQSIRFDTRACDEFQLCQHTEAAMHQERYVGNNNFAWAQGTIDWIKRHVKTILFITIPVLLFLGIWFVTGDIWATLILLEILMELLASMDF